MSSSDRSRRPGLDSVPALDLWGDAAVREYFLPDELLSAWLKRHSDASPSQQRQAVVAALDLQAIGEPQTEGSGASPLELPLPHRVAVLERLGRDRAAQAISTIAPRQRTVTEATLSALVLGHALPLDTDDREQLVALQKAEPFARALGIAPRFDPTEIARRLGRATFLQTLGGPDLHRFVGRRAVLRQLRTIWASHSTQPVLIEGPGGIGKSTMVARFIAELLDSPDPNEPPDAVFHLDFDRPRLQQIRAAGLLAEVARQARQWGYAGEFAELEKIASDVDYSSADGETVENVRRGSEGHREYLSFAKRLLKALPREQPRVLLFIDSFEQVEAYDDFAADAPAQVADLLRRAGARVLCVYASRAFLHPKRISAASPIRIARFSAREAEEFLRNEAGRLGLPIEAGIAKQVYTAVGRSPLALRLAVGLLEIEGDDFDISRWGVKARDSHERVQAELYDRYLLRLRYKPLRKLARPGLLLRRLTPEIIAKVLAVPCGLDLHEDSPDRLFKLARKEGQLFVTDPSDAGALRHRQDVRGVMLGSLDASLDAEQARRINEAAVAYYENAAADSIGRIEELYHRLRLDQPADVLDSRWVPTAGRLLRASQDEFPAAARAYLRKQLKAASLELGVDPGPGGILETLTVTGTGRVTPQPTEALPQSEWNELRNLATKVIQSGGRGGNVISWLGERDLARIDGPLGDIFAQALAMEGHFEELLAGADALLVRRVVDPPDDVRKRVLALAGSIQEGRQDLVAAERYWSAALESARHAIDPLDRLSALVGCIRIRRKLERGLGQRQGELRDAVLIVSTNLPQLRERRVQAREAAAELGEHLAGRVGNDNTSQRLLELVRYVLDIGEAFPSAVDDSNRASEIGRILLGYASASARELGSMVLRLTYGEPEAVGRVIEVMRAEVDWTLERATQVRDDEEVMRGFREFPAT